MTQCSHGCKVCVKPSLTCCVSRLWGDSGQHPLHDPDLHIQVWCCAVHSASGCVEAAAPCRAVCTPTAWVENICHTEDGLWQPQQGCTSNKLWCFLPSLYLSCYRQTTGFISDLSVHKIMCAKCLILCRAVQTLQSQDLNHVVYYFRSPDLLLLFKLQCPYAQNLTFTGREQKNHEYSESDCVPCRFIFHCPSQQHPAWTDPLPSPWFFLPS